MNSLEGQDYRMSFTTCGLSQNESLDVARLHIEAEPWTETVRRALDKHITTLPKRTSNQRILREISYRLSALDEAERTFLIEDADRYEQRAILWVAICRMYQFVREYTVEVIQERYFSRKMHLPLESFNIFFDAKAEWNDNLEKLSETTKLRLRQTLFRIMREAGIISGDHKIQNVILSVRLRLMILEKNPDELAIFPSIPNERIHLDKAMG